jgi:hypothetical protein
MTIKDLIAAAHAINGDLVLTEVEERDIETALDTHCAGWSEENRRSVIRLAAEFADVKATALWYTTEDPCRSTVRTKNELEHYRFLAIQLGAALDLPVGVDLTEAEREQSILWRFSHPLSLESRWVPTTMNDDD